MTKPNFVVNPDSGNPFPEIRGRAIRVDEVGRVSLNDVWQAVGSPESQQPKSWRKLPHARNGATAVLNRLSEKGRKSPLFNSSIESVLYAERGRHGGTWAHPLLAIQYAAYINAELGAEIAEIFLRHKIADPTLADDILQRASDEANEWAARRADGRLQRNALTSTWAQRGVNGRGYADCTNKGYLGVYGKTARELKAERGLPSTSNVRDHFTSDELAVQTLADVAARKRIVATDAYGNEECGDACFRSGRNLRDFLEREAQDIEASNQDRKRR